MTNLVKSLVLLGLMSLATERGAEALEKRIVTDNQTKTSYNVKASTSSYSIQKSTAPAKKNQIYIIVGQSLLNPSEYNNEIRKVSVSDESVYGPTMNAGIGYQRDLSDKLAGRLEVSMNSQKKIAYKHDIPSNTDIPFGYNEMTLYNIDPEIVYKVPMSSSTFFEAGLGIPITIARVTSANEDEKGTSTTAMIGGKVSLDLSHSLKDYFIKYGVELRTGSVETLNISAPTVRIKAGRKF